MKGKIKKIEIKCEKVTMNPPVTHLVDRDKEKVVGIDYCKGMELRQQRLAGSLEYSQERHSCYYNSHGDRGFDCLFMDLPLKELEKYLNIPEREPVGCLRYSLERCCNCGDLTAWRIAPEREDIWAIKELGFTVAKVFGLGGSRVSHLLCGNCDDKRVDEIDQIDKKYGLFLKENKK